MNKKKGLAVLLMLLALVPMFAGEPVELTLDEAISSARSSNINLQQAQIQLNNAIRNQKAVMTTFMPTIAVGVEVDPTWNFESDLSKLTYQSSYGASGFDGSAFGYTLSAYASASFTFNGSMITDSKTRSLSKESAAISYDQTYNTIEEAVVTAYWNIAAMDLSIESTRLSFEEAERQYNQLQDMYASGLIDQLSLMQGKLAYNSAKLTLKAYEDSKDLLVSAFKNLTGVDYDFYVSEIPEMTFYALPEAEELVALYGNRNLDVQSARNSLESAKNGKTTTELATYVPIVSVGLTYAYMGVDGYYASASSTFDDYTHAANQLSGSVSVTVPISNMLPGSSYYHQIKDMDDTIKQAALNLQSVQDTLLEDVREAKITIEQYQDNLELLQDNLETAELSYELSQQSYNSGLITVDALSDSRDDYLSARMQLIQTQVSHLLSVYDLAYELNIDIEELNQYTI